MTSVGCNEICSLDWCNHTGQTLSGEKKLLLNEVGTELHSALVAITTAHEADSSSSSTSTSSTSSSSTSKVPRAAFVRGAKQSNVPVAGLAACRVHEASYATHISARESNGCA